MRRTSSHKVDKEPVTIKPFSIEDFMTRLETEKGFSFARYGDGTFMAMMGYEGVNCDGAKISYSQSADLEASILDRTITHGIGDKAVEIGAEEWLGQRGIKAEWYDCNVLHVASLRGHLFPFVRWLRQRKVVMIGPSHLTRLKGFPVQQFIETDQTGAFDQLDELQVIADYAIASGDVEAVLISAGTAAPPLVSRLHATHPWVNVLDVGSLWDAYVGVLSRKVFRKIGRRSIRDLGLHNFRQEVGAWWTT